MPFTVGELDNVANATLDFHMRGAPHLQTIQDRPLLDALVSGQKTFPGGKGDITVPVKGDYTTDVSGFTHDDTVTYANPANIKRASYPWKEIHAGIQLTMTELKHDGISVVDSLNGAETAEHSAVEETRLTGIFQDKLEDMSEGWSRGVNNMLLEDGSQDSKEVPGILSMIVDDPTTGTLGGISRATHAWFRNRSLVGASKITHNTSTSALINALRPEFRQLRRYEGSPRWKIIAGSDFLDALEQELFAKGNMSDTGFTATKSTDMAMADVSYKGNKFFYDPSLDDKGLAKRCLIIDTKHIYLDVMEGEDMKRHSPARPSDQYVLFRAMTWTGGLVCDQINSSGVYEIA